MTDQYKQIVKMLPMLERGELEKVRTRIGALLHLSPSAPDLRTEYVGYAVDKETWVLDCISHVMEGTGYNSISFLRMSPGISEFRSKLPPLLRMLERADKSKTVQRAILLVGINLLQKNLTQLSIPVTGRTIMRHVHRIPAVLDVAFPGYVKAGLLGLIITRGNRYVRKQPSDSPKGSPPR